MQSLNTQKKTPSEKTNKDAKSNADATVTAQNESKVDTGCEDKSKKTKVKQRNSSRIQQQRQRHKVKQNERITSLIKMQNRNQGSRK